MDHLIFIPGRPQVLAARSGAPLVRDPPRNPLRVGLRGAGAVRRVGSGRWAQARGGRAVGARGALAGGAVRAARARRGRRPSQRVRAARASLSPPSPSPPPQALPVRSWRRRPPLPAGPRGGGDQANARPFTF